MRLGSDLISSLDLRTAATEVTAGKLDRFPPLIMDMCLSGATEPLVAEVRSASSVGIPVHVEVSTMPRRGFSPRPVSIMAPVIRTVYTALTGALAANSGTPERARDAWDHHKNFGYNDAAPSDDDYLVEFDIASCYEYIDHSLLLEELVAQTGDVDRSSAVVELLGEMYRNRRGLPQLLKSSDVLGDTYLAVMERQLLRRGYKVSRYADDFKVISPEWGHATGVVEDAAEMARGLGLVLSTEKTRIWKRSTIYAREQEKKQFISDRFQGALKEQNTLQLFVGFYGDQEVIEVEPDEEEAACAAFRQILAEWVESQPDEISLLHSDFLVPAIQALSRHQERVPLTWIIDLVFRRPLLLQVIADYLLQRTEEVQENWEVLAQLAAMKRQSPWAKAWLIHVALGLESIGSESQDLFMGWAARQLADRHELVRSEAAWYLSVNEKVSENSLSDLYRSASSLTRPALAAACGALPDSAGLVKAIRQDVPLVRAAHRWGMKEHAND